MNLLTLYKKLIVNQENASFLDFDYTEKLSWDKDKNLIIVKV